MVAPPLTHLSLFQAHPALPLAAAVPLVDAALEENRER